LENCKFESEEIDGRLLYHMIEDFGVVPWIEICEVHIQWQDMILEELNFRFCMRDLAS
jgi:hypothetical protein